MPFPSFKNVFSLISHVAAASLHFSFLFSLPCFSPAFFHHWLVCFLQYASYHCPSLCKRHASMFPAPSQSVPTPIRLAATWQRGPPLSVSPSSVAAPAAWALSLAQPPAPQEPAWLIKGKQTQRFPPALCKILLIKECKSNFMIH